MTATLKMTGTRACLHLRTIDIHHSYRLMLQITRWKLLNFCFLFDELHFKSFAVIQDKMSWLTTQFFSFPLIFFLSSSFLHYCVGLEHGNRNILTLTWLWQLTQVFIFSASVKTRVFFLIFVFRLTMHFPFTILQATCTKRARDQCFL